MNTPAEEAYWNLVAAARAEDGIAADEQRVLNAHVLKLGLDSARAREIQAAATAENPPRIRVPKDGKGRLDTLRAILEVAAADGSIAPKELGVIRALAERCSIPTSSLDRLLALALRKSPDKLDKAFASLQSGGDGPELIEFTGPVRNAPASPLRSMPFAARLAPATRTCEDCRLAFAHRDAYARYCRVCVVNHGVKNITGGRVETLAGLLFLLFLIPAGFLVQKLTGLYSWGYYAGREMDAYDYDRSYSYRRRRSSWSLYLLVPALGLTVIVAWFPAWMIALAVERMLRKR